MFGAFDQRLDALEAEVFRLRAKERQHGRNGEGDLR
jgi:hypothetical protein